MKNIREIRKGTSSSSKSTDDRLAVDAVGVAEASAGHRSHACAGRWGRLLSGSVMSSRSLWRKGDHCMLEIAGFSFLTKKWEKNTFPADKRVETGVTKNRESREHVIDQNKVSTHTHNPLSLSLSGPSFQLQKAQTRHTRNSVLFSVKTFIFFFFCNDKHTWRGTVFIWGREFGKSGQSVRKIWRCRWRVCWRT